MSNYRQQNTQRQTYASYYGVNPAIYEDESTRAAFMSKVYYWTALATLLCIGGVALAFAFDIPMIMVKSKFGLIIAFLLLIGLSLWAQIATMRRSSTALVAFILFAIAEGVISSPLLYFAAKYIPDGMKTIAFAGGLAFCIFGGLASIAVTTKRSLSTLGGLLSSALIAGFFIVIFGMFTNSWGYHLFLSGFFVVLMSGYILYDTQKIYREYPTDAHLNAALNLFIDIWMLFYHILRVLLLLQNRD